MKCLDVIFFQAEITPEKLAIVARGHVISYGKLAHGIVSAERRLAAAGVSEGQTVGLNIAHPIDHFILICALYRLRVASASIGTALDVYLDSIKLDMVLADSINPVVSQKQPAAKLFLVDTSWFTDKVTFSVAERNGSRRDPKPDWICRVTCVPDDARQPPIMTTSRTFEAQLTTYALAAPPDWDRMISIVGFHTLAGLVLGMSALWLGRTLCVAEVAIARNLIVAYKHHYLVATTQDIEPILTQQATDFMALQVLRVAFVAGQRFAPVMMTRLLETISSNTVVSYTNAAIGIVAYGAAARIKDVEGAVGFVAPWVEVQVVDEHRAPLAAEQDGELRFRDRSNHTGTRSSGTDGPDAGWIYPNQRACLRKNNLLVIR
jgi:acyl-coenzyme A synthetase/AMP-(fatty) acid ligase